MVGGSRSAVKAVIICQIVWPEYGAIFVKMYTTVAAKDQTSAANPNRSPVPPALTASGDLPKHYFVRVSRQHNYV